jgi:hypothetical protein
MVSASVIWALASLLSSALGQATSGTPDSPLTDCAVFFDQAQRATSLNRLVPPTQVESKPDRVLYKIGIGDICDNTDEYSASFQRDASSKAHPWQWNTRTRPRPDGVYQRVIGGVVTTYGWTGRIHIELNNGPKTPSAPDLVRQFKKSFMRAIDRCIAAPK